MTKLKKKLGRFRLFRSSLSQACGVLSLLFVGATLMGCQVTPVKYNQVQTGAWKATAFMKNRARKESAVVQMDIKAHDGKKMRIDITSALGGHLMTLVMVKNQVQIIDFRNRRYYSGQANKRAMQKVISFPLNPKLFYNVLFDRPVASKNWICTKDAKAYLSECKKLRDGTAIYWTHRKVTRKRVIIEHESVTLRLDFTSFQKTFKEKNNQFIITPPESFKKYKL